MCGKPRVRHNDFDAGSPGGPERPSADRTWCRQSNSEICTCRRSEDRKRYAYWPVINIGFLSADPPTVVGARMLSVAPSPMKTTMMMSNDKPWGAAPQLKEPVLVPLGDHHRVVDLAQAPRDVRRGQANTARFYRKGFGSAAQAKIDV